MDGVVTIALDAMGGDHAPVETVAGALAAVRPGELHVLVVGIEARIREALGGEPPAGITIRHAADVITFDDDPRVVVRAKPEASLVVATQLVADGTAQAAVSAGSTGAMLASSLTRMRRIPGVIRPGLAAVMPGHDGPLILVDAGATVDARADQLLQFAHMGTILGSDVLGIGRPRCGLLTIGEERGKGNALSKEAYELLVAAPDIDFCGNIEGNDLFRGVVDVVVTDGFAGNVALKTAEGTAKYVLGLVREAAYASPVSRLGGFLLRPAVRRVRSRVDPETYGGAYLLGLSGVSVIAHGNSSRVAIANAIRFAAQGVRHELTAHLTARIGRRAVAAPDGVV